MILKPWCSAWQMGYPISYTPSCVQGMDVYHGLHHMSLESWREDRPMYREAGARRAVLAAMEATNLCDNWDPQHIHCAQHTGTH